MNILKELFTPIVITIIILLTISVAIALLWQILEYIRKRLFYNRVKTGTPVRLDAKNEQSGWYVVKKRIKDTVELILIIPDAPKKDLDKTEPDVVCDISLLKPL